MANTLLSYYLVCIFCFGGHAYEKDTTIITTSSKTEVLTGEDVTLSCSPDAINASSKYQLFSRLSLKRQLYTSTDNSTTKSNLLTYWPDAIQFTLQGSSSVADESTIDGPNYWKYNVPDRDTVIRSNYNYTRSLMQMSIVMLSVSQEDSGIYTCEVMTKNESGKYVTMKLISESETLDVSAKVKPGWLGRKKYVPKGTKVTAPQVKKVKNNPQETSSGSGLFNQTDATTPLPPKRGQATSSSPRSTFLSEENGKLMTIGLLCLACVLQIIIL